MANAQAPALVKEVPAVQSSLEAPSGKSVGTSAPENCSEALPMFSTSTVFGLSRLVEPSFVESNFNDGGSARSIFNTCLLKGIGDIKIAGSIQGQAVRNVQTAAHCSLHSVWRHFGYRIVTWVGDINVARRIYCHCLWAMRLPTVVCVPSGVILNTAALKGSATYTLPATSTATPSGVLYPPPH